MNFMDLNEAMGFILGDVNIISDLKKSIKDINSANKEPIPEGVVERSNRYLNSSKEWLDNFVK